MANTSIDLVGLDFASLKSNLKSFLRNNTQFKDMDFEGSNINVLLDLLAYNTYLNGFYTNMVASEMFLDTAQLRDSIVSHAKELNYTPRSFRSAVATIQVNVTPTSNSTTSVVIPKFTSFTTRVGSNTFSFSTDENLVLTSSNNGVFSTNLDVYEGIVITETFVINQSNTTQRFVLSNQTIDTASITVSIYEDGGQNIITYSASEKLVGITSTSRVFFVQAAENNQYEIKFGDGIFGRKPKDGSTVVVKYRNASGELPNGASVFVSDSTIDGHANVSTSIVTPAALGSVSESLDSIRFNAPRNFQVQDRAVTAIDYEILLQTRFPEIESISVFGGEETNPPQYGKVFVCVDVANAEGASLTSKQAYKSYIQERTPLTINVDFVDPEFLYLKIDTNVRYNTNITTKTTTDIRTLVQGAISTFNTSYLNSFNTSFYFSNLVKTIDNADNSILGNDTEIFLIKRVVPTINTAFNAAIDFQNELGNITTKKTSTTEKIYGGVIESTQFVYLNTRCILVDDSLGNLLIAARQTDTINIVKSIGTVDYTTGRVSINNMNISSFVGPYIEIKARTLSRNVVSVQNAILVIDDIDVNVNVIGARA